ncbi:MAG: hypothetical protein A2268_13860 [Candidatus Raymondbacteria bacterium RifOxyA12_full_50_37]|uniref:STAS domain-containing protein n=1 Tax=Candidatus Raymondbacteria bacterium RIFOXYD12_FULL_49_13 TaxID=1817890 RepID=A0A1F7F4P2_UNCRA|nr:MAG: hypothetical protein A2248_00790 [Candidatus Raymondbacteria bacterium RIFOXYA2_FULL_49_16]OGJ91928.1 MAG: hypothetical protein A2268_13860 [Candidatus Raymondbacteria bacterium RifOxyA12_full_50_37]OGJ92843.1 MAG: hypothetical protein A2487_09730 [Candidatus Raymondbacteria bacterium RifOxyC12_full_50_8]OGJ95474.1 MAG: hypothetical protein A2453_05295 [Candidatus Raymondbacteria bacterium RIFOXYC2_FULL_50_21]OGK01630.1 MAG: hypothetical protein A2519_07300 [Candidatus Raymondbacteria b
MADIHSSLSLEPEPIIRLPEHFNRDWVSSRPAAGFSHDKPVVLDFAGVKDIDSSGISLVHVLKRTFERSNQKIILRNITRPMLSAITAVPQPVAAVSVKLGERFPSSVGTATLAVFSVAASALSVLTEMFYWGTIGAFKKLDMKKGALGEQMFQLGYKALGIVALLSMLIGIVLALQAAIQLRMYGAGIFLAPMIGISMIRELGPILTAIILAGRTGSATTAEIATMMVGEEIDALKTMGINPIQYVVVPKFWAITLTMPILTMLSTATGIFGGFLVSLAYLDISSSLFWSQLSQNIFIKDVLAGLIKSIVFAWLIIWVGVFYGFRVRGGAEAVGRETTASVVTGIFIIIITDALFSFII